MNEHPSNYGIVHPGCAPGPNPELIEDKTPEDFIGLFVKRSFMGTYEGKPKVEHMWVEVESVKDGKLVGLLNNDPVLDHGDLKCDNEVTVELAQIEEVFTP